MSTKATATVKEIISEINKLRSDPPLYAKKVEEYTHYFTDKIIKLPNLNVKIQTQEGSAPYFETIEYLKEREKGNELIPSKALCEIAQEIAENVKDSETGEIDEELGEQIIDKHGSFDGKFTRAMDFGGFTSEQVVINFLVCDGDLERTQREPLLGTGLKKIGVAFGKHDVYSTVCVLVTTTEFHNTKDEDDTMIFEEDNTPNNDEEKKEKEKKEREKLENERIEKEIIEKEKEKERLEKERIENERKENEKIEREKEKERERLEKERIEKERVEKEKIEREKEKERKRLEKEKIEREQLEKERMEKEKIQKEKFEKEKKEKERLEEEKKKKKETTKKKYEATNNNKSEPTNIFKLKKKIYAYETVPKEQLPEGVASMTKSDTIVIEGGKRYKKITYNKVMSDGSKKTEEVKECLD